jgi:hypothetical protein
MNRVLRHYDVGYELSPDGEIVRLAPDGMKQLITARLPPEAARTDAAKIANAVHTFLLGRSTREQRKHAVRDLVDILEFHRPTVKTQLTKDEADLFNIANNFALRHHRPNQKDDYDDAWLSWLFYVYLATVHLVLARVAGRDGFGEAQAAVVSARTLRPPPTPVDDPFVGDDDIPF